MNVGQDIANTWSSCDIKGRRSSHHIIQSICVFRALPKINWKPKTWKNEAFHRLIHCIVCDGGSQHPSVSAKSQTIRLVVLHSHSIRLQCTTNMSIFKIFTGCPHNEVHNSCGSACPTTCQRPIPSDFCTQQCLFGCECQAGHLRNSNGQCVRPEHCTCGANQVLKTCGSACPARCGDTSPRICTAQCVAGCFCNDGFVLNASGQCVLPNQCECANSQWQRPTNGFHWWELFFFCLFVFLQVKRTCERTSNTAHGLIELFNLFVFMMSWDRE